MGDGKQKTQITLDLDMGDSAMTIAQIFDMLDKDDMKELAREVISSWVEEPITAERRARERMILDKMMREKSYGGGPQYENEDVARRHYSFRDAMKTFKSTREKTLEDVHSALYTEIKAEVHRIVRDSKQMSKIVEVASQVVIESLPRMVQNSLTSWFTEHLNMMGNILHLNQQSDDQGELLQRIKEHLNIL